MLKIHLCSWSQPPSVSRRQLLILLLAMLVGCTPPPTVSEDDFEADIVRPDPLTMLVIDNPEVGAVIARQWSARRDGELKIIDQTQIEFSQNDFTIPAAVDVILYPPGLLADLVSRNALLKLPRTLWMSDELNKNEFLGMHRSVLVRHADNVWAVPLGGPQFSLMYRRDFVEQKKLKFPIDWTKLTELASPQPAETGESSDLDSPVTLPLGEGWAGQVFLARVAPLIRNRGVLSTVFARESMQPLISDAPFVLALEELKKIAIANPQQLELTPEQVFEQVIKGQVEIGMTWPGRYASNSPQKTNIESESEVDATATDTLGSDAGFGFASMPGSEQWFDMRSKKWIQRAPSETHDVALIGFSGLIGSVVNHSRNVETGFSFLEWLASKSTSLVTTVLSPRSGPFRKSHMADPTRWTNEQISDRAAQDYAKVIEDVNDNDVVFMFPQIPGRQRYLDSLDQNIRACLRGEQEPPNALAQTAKQWNAITDELGREQQISELRNDASL